MTTVITKWKKRFRKQKEERIRKKTEEGGRGWIEKWLSERRRGIRTNRIKRSSRRR